MMKITVIALGKLKEKYLVSACDEYIKRLSRFCSLNLIELSPEHLPENPSLELVERALYKEAEHIKKKIPEKDFKIALCVEGRELSSEEFSGLIEKNKNGGRGITLIIGSSFGMSEEIKKICDLRLSVSKMTFPHQLFRVLLLEQIYRGFMISEGSTYHK